MSLRRAALLVCLIWAGIYLPALGSLEIKGEEGRRVLPGLTMIRTGDWVVPQMGGEPYLRKPPLVNWVAAGSVLVWGSVNEWTVRFPSVVATLAGGLVLLVGVARRHGVATGFVAAVFHLTCLGLMEKGRLIEIEALYIACAAGAFGVWIGWCAPRIPGTGGPTPGAERAWIGWTGVGLCLGLGWVAKGPVHLLYFYGPVLAILGANRRVRDLAHPAHCLGLAVMAGVFALWAVPYLEATRSLGSGGVWADQFTGRLSGEGFRVGAWLLNFPRGLVNFLPWLVFLPWAIGPRADRESRALGWVCVALWGAVMAVPESAPRYTFPVIPPLMVLLARAASEGLGADARRVWGRWTLTRRDPAVVGLAARSGGVMVGLTLVYALIVVPFLKPHQDDRRLGEALRAAVPPGEALVALDLGYRPFEFYLGSSLRHAPRMSAIPSDARALLCDGRKVAAVRALRPWREAEERARLRAEDGREWVVLVRAGG